MDCLASQARKDGCTPMVIEESCVFCQKLARGDFDEKWDHPLGRVVRFEPLNPVVRGHMLFVPEQHVDNAPADSQIFAETSRCAAEYAQRQLAACNIITSAGWEATQSVFHLHVHYVPRFDGDGLKLPWTGQSSNFLHELDEPKFERLS